MRLLGLFFFLAGGAFAGEYAVLASGARLHIDRHEADGAKVRLYYGTGFVEMNSTIVRGYETEDPVPVPAAEAVAGPEAPPRHRRPRPWNWRTRPPTATGCRGNWYAASWLRKVAFSLRPFPQRVRSA